MVTNEDGHITQNVVYIPFGEVFVEERNGSWASPYLFNAKELDEEIGLYYYGARYLDPTAAVWLSTDPLQEKYPGMSPYNYCHNSPITRLDPSGKNDYEIDSNGYLVRELYNKKTRFFIVKDGKRVKSLTFNENIVQKSGKQTKTMNQNVNGKKTITKIDYDLYQIYGEYNAKKVFEFLADNTDVEWGKLTYGVDVHKDCVITTSHEHSVERGVPSLLSDGRYNKYNIYDLVHSHNERYASFPSGLGQNDTGGDVNFAKWTRRKLKNSPNQDFLFRIYFAPEKFYFYYSENSKYEDFFDEKGNRLGY